MLFGLNQCNIDTGPTDWSTCDQAEPIKCGSCNGQSTLNGNKECVAPSGDKCPDGCKCDVSQKCISCLLGYKENIENDKLKECIFDAYI